jgi:hypothetical protein
MERAKKFSLATQNVNADPPFSAKKISTCARRLDFARRSVKLSA